MIDKKNKRYVNVLLNNSEYELVKKFVTLHNEKNVKLIDLGDFEKISISKLLRLCTINYLMYLSEHSEKFFNGKNGKIL